MSYGLTIYYVESDKEGTYIPIATARLFREVWLPVANTLELEEIPRFESGLEVDQEFAPKIIDELTVLKEFLVSSPGDYPTNKANDVIRHIDSLINGLTFIMNNSDARGSIA